jgi:hypothetical protein
MPGDCEAKMTLSNLSYDRDRFNSLPDIEVADKQRKVARSLELLLGELKPIFQKHNMCDRWAITLLHKHWSIAEAELPIQEKVVPSSPMEFESSPRSVDFSKPFWPLTLVVNDRGLRFDPMEFTTDPETAKFNAATRANPQFEREVCETLSSLKLDTTYGLIALKSNSRGDFEFVEYNPGQRRSVLREIPSCDADRRRLIETCWRIPLFECAVDCEASCFARCTVTDEGHNGDHAPAHNPNG